MSSRLTRAAVAAILQATNEREGRPTGPRELGALSLDSPYSIHNVHETVNDSGGVSCLFTGSLSEVRAYLRGRADGWKAASS